MNKELKDKWIAALRSGKYEQGYTFLNKNNKFCCLGVLCEVDELEKIPYKNNTISYVYNKKANEAVPTFEYIQDIGLNNYIDFYGSQKRVADCLINMNDVRFKSFNQIADWIEENV